ncbi:hypothetical protein OS493_013352 [Desmophyllum pertusum]|uniref:Uncharacterized protein n=1 Tax=Desmophyllum pertusum TaxID=174260 RepID=A0A9X0CGX9_9CNID|nr:hypothetical protein OS493_013352 [Desmophyllum pertusum]
MLLYSLKRALKKSSAPNQTSTGSEKDSTDSSEPYTEPAEVSEELNDVPAADELDDGDASVKSESAESVGSANESFVELSSLAQLLYSLKRALKKSSAPNQTSTGSEKDSTDSSEPYTEPAEVSEELNDVPAADELDDGDASVKSESAESVGSANESFVEPRFGVSSVQQLIDTPVGTQTASSPFAGAVRQRSYDSN